MIQKNPSLYFENDEMFIKLHPDQAPLVALRNAVKSNGCPEELIEQVINSAIAHEVNLKVTPDNNTMSLTKDGVEYGSFEAYNPSYEELVTYISDCFDGLEDVRAKSIVDVLLSKQALSAYSDGKLYRTKVLLPRIPLAL